MYFKHDLNIKFRDDQARQSLAVALRGLTFLRLQGFPTRGDVQKASAVIEELSLVIQNVFMAQRGGVIMLMVLFMHQILYETLAVRECIPSRGECDPSMI